jgi:hypothetical protein
MDNVFDATAIAILVVTSDTVLTKSFPTLMSHALQIQLR